MRCQNATLSTAYQPASTRLEPNERPLWIGYSRHFDRAPLISGPISGHRQTGTVCLNGAKSGSGETSYTLALSRWAVMGKASATIAHFKIRAVVFMADFSNVRRSTKEAAIAAAVKIMGWLDRQHLS